MGILCTNIRRIPFLEIGNALTFKSIPKVLAISEKFKVFEANFILTFLLLLTAGKQCDFTIYVFQDCIFTAKQYLVAILLLVHMSAQYFITGGV
jgi:hypothetical protein